MIAILKAVTVGVVGAGLTYFRYPKGALELFGTSFSMAMGVGVSLLIGSAFAEAIHAYVLPHIHSLDKMSDPIASVLAGASNSVAVTTLFYASDPKIINDLGLPLIIACAMASEITGDYIYSKFLHPMLQ